MEIEKVYELLKKYEWEDELVLVALRVWMYYTWKEDLA